MSLDINTKVPLPMRGIVKYSLEMAWLNNQWNGLIGMNYFTYFDGESKKIELGFNTDLGKSDILVWNKFVCDGMASKESLIDNNEQFANKMYPRYSHGPVSLSV
jgi:hypothetical protein